MSGLVESSADARSKTIGQNFRCRAWVNINSNITFSPNPTSAAVRASGNVSSIGYLATGRLEVNLTQPMPDTNYAVFVDGNVNDSNVDTRRSSRATHFYTNGVKLVSGLTSSDSAEDFIYTYVAFFR